MLRALSIHRTLTTFLLLLAVFALTTTPAHATANKKYASIVMDADTGMILHQRHANKSLHPASLTKVMTLLMLFEEMERGNIRLNDRIRISNHAASMIPSKLGLAPGSHIRVKDAINALAIKSANDIAVAVAEHIGGTEGIFARMMTRRAHEIGMSRTYFKNASGLHNKYQISTARDMAKLAKFVITTYPDKYRYYARKSFTYRGVTHRSHNKLMKNYPGMDGMKTGYITASGFNLIASATRHNRRLIGVVFGGRSSSSRNAHMRTLLNQGFKRVGNITIARRDVPRPERKPNLLLALEALNTMTAAAVAPSSGNDTHSEQKWATLNPALQSGMFAKLIGEGDFDPTISSRIETGLLAISAHQGKKYKHKTARALKANYTPSKRLTNRKDWTIQLGAYKSRAQVEKALRTQSKRLPINLRRNNNAHIAPLKTKKGWLFRGRIGGYEKTAALQACRILKDCITIPPK